MTFALWLWQLGVIAGNSVFIRCLSDVDSPSSWRRRALAVAGRWAGGQAGRRAGGQAGSRQQACLVGCQTLDSWPGPRCGPACPAAQVQHAAVPPSALTRCGYLRPSTIAHSHSTLWPEERGSEQKNQNSKPGTNAKHNVTFAFERPGTSFSAGCRAQSSHISEVSHTFDDELGEKGLGTGKG